MLQDAEEHDTPTSAPAASPSRIASGTITSGSIAFGNSGSGAIACRVACSHRTDGRHAATDNRR